MNVEGNNVKTTVADTETFWSLIKKYNGIIIPEYQRGYAQGRKSAKLIRERLIGDFKKSLLNSAPKELNFIFGGEDSSHNFLPVDGQQRLTALFLLYWYIFSRDSESDEYIEVLRKFDYKSRTTSSDFCKEIVNLISKEETRSDLWSDSSKKLSEKIKEYPWFTSNIENDLTVDSMLTVMNEIDRVFHDVPNLHSLTEKITDTSCKLITFKCLNTSSYTESDLNHYNDRDKNSLQKAFIHDLYIKMNARGKLLSDFEIFKAQLQIQLNPLDEKLDILKEHFEQIKTADTVNVRTKLICDFNEKYTDLFFNVVDNGNIIDNTATDVINNDDNEDHVQNYDTAIMNFFNEFISISYFLACHSQGINSKIYSKIYNEVRSKDGKSFASFIENHGKADIDVTDNSAKIVINDPLIEDRNIADNALIHGFNKALHILDIFVNQYRSSTFSTRPLNILVDHSSDITNEFSSSLMEEHCLIASYHNDNSLQTIVRRHGLFEFINRFFSINFPEIGSTEYEAYKEWSRFIYNITFLDGWDLYKSTENAIQEIAFINHIISLIDEPLSKKSVLNAIIKCDICKASRFSMQIEEEKEKAKLILEDPLWENAILEAELLFTNSRIWFLLDIASVSVLGEKIEGEYSYDIFTKILRVSKELFDCDCNITDRNLAVKFEQALLCIHSNRDFSTSHLLPVNKSSYAKKFLWIPANSDSENSNYRHSLAKHSLEQEDGRRRYKILKELLNYLTANNDTVINALTDFVTSKSQNFSNEWSSYFIKDESLFDAMMDSKKFKNCIQVDYKPEDTNEYFTLLFTTRDRWSESAELYTMLLYQKLQKQIEMRMTISKSKNYYSDDGIPYRHIEIVGSNEILYYSKGKYHSSSGSAWDSIESVMLDFQGKP